MDIRSGWRGCSSDTDASERTFVIPSNCFGTKSATTVKVKTKTRHENTLTKCPAEVGSRRRELITEDDLLLKAMVNSMVESDRSWEVMSPSARPLYRPRIWWRVTCLTWLPKAESIAPINVCITRFRVVDSFKGLFGTPAHNDSRYKHRGGLLDTSLW